MYPRRVINVSCSLQFDYYGSLYPLQRAALKKAALEMIAQVNGHLSESGPSEQPQILVDASNLCVEEITDGPD